ncbi:DUF3857 domain-containing protein [Hymenobacter sp. HMF4947]|uniref:DUF3857 domain-containing protein n=1 Tax=Hymenobacter ginkgonis TaxID=2682976 RepID=A0A7K1TJ44_9BACT|nr:DUF3857 and transglutaminase domain-containing protein [Hymenobacter ginkgonis]MVN78437.1 DUF3857 domain-containing protein [Hymenobacter ginkgonis]
MIKKILILTQVSVGISALLSGAVSAQQAPVKVVEIKFGKPEPADFVAKNFVADSAAPAVVLYDFGATRFQLNGNSFQLESERVTRIKVLKKAGYDVATVEVPLYHRDGSEEKITNLRGFTYNEVGGKLEKVKLETSNSFLEERTKNVRVRKFTLPNVREGAVIEYSYTVTSDFLFNFQDWTFQREIPTRWSEFRATIPEYFDYKMLMQGYEPLALQAREDGIAQYTVRSQGGFVEGGGSALSGNTGRVAASAETITPKVTNYHWAMQNVPALRDEPYMTTPRDYVARINFELAGRRMPGESYHNVAGTWQKINADLLSSDEFGGQLNRASFLALAVKPLMTQYPDPAARAAAVRDLIVKSMKYDGTNHHSASGPLKHSYELHRGTAADINLLLIAALRQAGLPAQPVLLSTRAHGRVNQTFPLLEQFNYVIGMLPLPDNQELLLDATEPLLPCGVLPTRCLNQVGRLVMDKEEGRWVDLTPSQRHNHFQDIKLTVDAQGNLSGQVRDEFSGYTGAAVREKLQQLGEKKYVTELTSQHPNWEVPSYAFTSVSEMSQPLRLTYELRQQASTAGTAQELYLKPLEAFGEGQNPFRHEQRNYPIDFGASTQDVIMLTLTLPPGYTAELPKQAVIDLPEKGGRYVYSATSPTPSTVQLMSRLTLNKPVYSAQEYTSLREFYRLALAKQAEALVLKKI